MARYGTVIAAAMMAALALSGGTGAGPRTPDPLPGLPEPFLGVNVIGNGGAAASIDSYGNVVTIRSPGPATEAIVGVPHRRQRTGTVDPDSGITLRVGKGKRKLAPAWQAERVTQNYIEGSNALVTRMQHPGMQTVTVDAMAPDRPAWLRTIHAKSTDDGPRSGIRIEMVVDLERDVEARTTLVRERQSEFEVWMGGHITRCSARPAAEFDRRDDDLVIRWNAKQEIRAGISCAFDAGSPPSTLPTIQQSIAADRAWLAHSAPLGGGAPRWAHGLYARSLLTLRALTDATSGAAPAALRDFWHYVWPRDAATVAMALAAAGHTPEARAIVRFLGQVDTDDAARFTGQGRPVLDGREPQGDSAGWLSAARQAIGLKPPPSDDTGAGPATWRDRGDWTEQAGERGDFIANAIVAGAPSSLIRDEFAYSGLLVRKALDPDSALDAAVAWASRPFHRPALAPLVRRTLLRLVDTAGPYGIQPTSQWHGRGTWSAPTLFAAWALAGLGDRANARSLLKKTRATTTSTLTIPERVNDEGVAVSATPLSWSHAIAILAMREMWPAPRNSSR